MIRSEIPQNISLLLHFFGCKRGPLVRGSVGCVCVCVCSVVSDSLWHHRPARLLSWECWVEYIKMRRILNGVHSFLCGCQKHGSGESKPISPINEYSRKTLCYPFYEGRGLVWWPAPRRLAGALSYGTIIEILSHCCWQLAIWAVVMAMSSLVREMHIAELVCFLCPHDHCYMSPLIKQYHAWSKRLTDIDRTGRLIHLITKSLLCHWELLVSISMSHKYLYSMNPST